VVGIDAEEQAFEAIKAGSMLATVYQAQDTQGATAVETAVKMLNGEEVPLDIIVKTVLKTSENIE